MTARNFYGVLRVQELGRDSASERRSLIHGTILHGTQYMAPEFAGARRPTTPPHRASGSPARGAASQQEAAQGRRDRPGHRHAGRLRRLGDVYRFYEINPAVLAIAQRDFTFLRDSDATIEVHLGDARLSLEREPKQDFDVLVIDAFSSDAIPVHLITTEALGIYRRHMKPGGIIAFHVTNRFLNLVPVVEALAHVHRC